MPGRIPQSFIDDLLARTDIVETIDRRVKLKRTGKNYSARCPFHEEKTPSFTVNPEKQFYYCFGCGAGGNALGFLMDYEKLDFPVAVEQLAGPLGLSVPRDEANRAADDAAQAKTRALYALMDAATQYYRTQLRKHPAANRAVDYLKQRGLSGEIARDFDLGFAPPGWDNLLQALGSSASEREQLLAAGMLVENTEGRSYDRFRDRIIFPIRDQRGRVIAFGGRVLGDDKPKYLNSPETPIYSKGRELYGLFQARRANRQLERVLVVEGYMDVIALAQNGITNAVATLGTATTRDHLQRLFRCAPELVFCFDGDSAGRQAAWRAAETALPALDDGRQLRFLFLPEGEDPDTWVRRIGRSEFERQLANAAPLETFLFERLEAGLELATMEGRARLSRLALPLLQQLPNGIYRELMIDALATKTGASREALLAAPGAAPQVPSPAAARPPPSTTSPARRKAPTPKFTPRSLTQSAIALLLHHPELAAEVGTTALPEADDDELRLLSEMLALLQRRPDSSTAALLGYWYGTPEGALLNRLAGEERLLPQEGVARQLTELLAAIAVTPALRDIDARIDKLRMTNYLEMETEQKQHLMALLRQRQALRSGNDNSSG